MEARDLDDGKLPVAERSPRISWRTSPVAAVVVVVVVVVAAAVVAVVVVAVGDIVRYSAGPDWYGGRKKRLIWRTEDDETKPKTQKH